MSPRLAAGSILALLAALALVLVLAVSRARSPREIGDAPPARQSAATEREPYLSAPLVLAPAPEPNDLRVELRAGGAIRGELRMPELWVRGFRCLVVTLRSAHLQREKALTLEAAPDFAFEGLPADDYELTAFFCPDEGTRVLAARQRVSVATNERVDLVVDCTGSEGAAVSGRLVGPPADQGSSGRVQAVAPEGGWHREGILEADGRFRVACRDDGPTVVTIVSPHACWFALVDGPRAFGTIDLGRTCVTLDATGRTWGAYPTIRPVGGPAGISVALLPEAEGSELLRLWGLPPGAYEVVFEREPSLRFEVPASGTVALR